jgi:AraC family transcriptional regulator
MRPADLLYLLRDIRLRLDGDVSLARLAKRSGWSTFHVQRVFRRTVGETPKRYTLRLRLEGAAANLLTRRETVTQIARASGFASHEVFTRAFRRHFGSTPTCYRSRALEGASREIRQRHAMVVESAGPCLSFYHFRLDGQHHKGSSVMSVESIARQVREAQPILLIRRRVARAELPGMLAHRGVIVAAETVQSTRASLARLGNT